MPSDEMSWWQAFWLGFVYGLAQVGEAIALPFMKVYELVTGQRLGRLDPLPPELRGRDAK